MYLHKICIPKRLVTDPEVSGFDLAVYSYLSLFSDNPANEPVNINPSSICYALYQSEDTKLVRQVTTSLERIAALCEDTIIKLPRGFMFTQRTLQESFQLYFYEDIKRILTVNTTSRFSLLKLYLVICASFKKDISVDDISYFASDYGTSWYAKCCNITIQTISSQLKKLEEMKIFYIIRNPLKSNIVCRWSDKGLLQKWALDQGYSLQQNNHSNHNRSLMQKYNRIAKLVQEGKDIPYSLNELKEIKKYVEHRNKLNIQHSNYYGKTIVYNLSFLTSIITSKEELCETEQKAI